MSAAPAVADRRAEAHLWLLLEEALVSVRRADVEAWEVWRSYRAVADALVATDRLHPQVADALAGELDDALAVRGVIPAGAFSASPWPELDVLQQPLPSPAPHAGRTWLDAEVERHLDLFASFAGQARYWAARDLVRIVAAPVRAFEAVGLLTAAEATAAVDEVVSSLHAAGVDPGRPAEPDVEPRPAWVAFLEPPPAPLPDSFEPQATRRLDRTVGDLAGRTVRLGAVSWTSDAIRLDLTVRPRPEAVDTGAATAPLHGRLVDDTGVLHLGQPMTARRGIGDVELLLRPGFGPGVRGFDLRLTKGGERVEASVAL